MEQLPGKIRCADRNCRVSIFQCEANVVGSSMVVPFPFLIELRVEDSQMVVEAPLQVPVCIVCAGSSVPEVSSASRGLSLPSSGQVFSKPC